MKNHLKISSQVILISFILLLSSCFKAQEPTVSTSDITAITKNSAASGGTITNDGGSEITERGVCWSLIENPTTNDSKTSDGPGVGPFSSNITGLNYNTKYYVRAYAINSAGTGYGESKSFTTLDCMYCRTVTYENGVVVSASSSAMFCGEELIQMLARPQITVGSLTSKVECSRTQQ